MTEQLQYNSDIDQRVTSLLAQHDFSPEDLRYRLQVTPGELDRSLGRLIKHGVVNRNGDRSKYFLTTEYRKQHNLPDVKKSAPIVAQHVRDISTPSSLVMSALRERPMKLKQLSEVTGIAPLNLYSHAMRLMAKNLVQRERSGREFIYRLHDSIAPKKEEPKQEPAPKPEQPFTLTPEVMDQLKRIMKQAFIEAHYEIQTRERKDAPPPPLKEKPRLPSVLIVGPLPVQQQELAHEFGDLFDLRFAKETKEVDQMVRKVQHVVGLTTFMNHSMFEIMKNNSNAKIHLVTGGMSSVKRKLEDMWCEINGEKK